MLLIVAHHYVSNSNLIPIMVQDYPSAKALFLFLFGCAGKIGINCFVLITGYFMCTSHITMRKGLKLLLQIELYNIIFFCVFAATGYIALTPKEIIKGIIPINSIKDGFVACYLVFWCFIPFLNVLIKGMNKKQHQILLGISLLVYSVFPQLSIDVSYNYVSWFIVVYLIASYFRLYPPTWSCNKKTTGLMAIGFTLSSIASIVVCPQIFSTFGKSPHFYFFIMDSNKPLAIATAVSAFLYFKNIDLGYNRLINNIAASAFGVLLIHTNNDAMRQWLWVDTLDNIGHYPGNIYTHAIVSVIIIYITCTLIDYLRIILIEKPFFKWFDKHAMKNSVETTKE